MSKWALWAAHRYLQPGAAAPRRVGPDGRLLLRPWRVPSLQARRAVSLSRAARAQPWWPRLFGLACIAVSCIFALDPVGSIPTHVAASSSARTGPRLASLAPVTGGSPAQLVWSPGEVSPPFTLVLLDSACRELLRRDGIAATSWELDATARAVLGQGGTFHAYVVGDRFGRPFASPLARLEIGRSGTSGGIVR